MKTILTLFFSFLLSVTAAHAVATNVLFIYTLQNCIISAPQSNMVAFFQGPNKYDAIFQSDKPIPFGFQSLTNIYYQLFMFRPEYGFRISLISDDGKAVQPTSMGAKYGMKFGEVKGFDKKALDMTPGYSHGRPYWAYATVKVPSSGRLLPSPDELFKLQKPGNYTMSIEMACLYRPGPLPPTNYYSTNIYFVRFPPVTLHVIKR